MTLSPPTIPAIADALLDPAAHASTLSAVRSTLERGDREAAVLWRALDRSGLLPLAAHRMVGVGADRSSRLHDALQSAVDVNRLRNAVLRKSAIEATRALTRAGIRTMWLKGIWLAHAMYEHPGLRMMSDIDLLVPEGSRREAAAALRTLGYEPAAGARDGDGAPEGSGSETLSRRTAVPGGDAVTIDLHDRLQVHRAQAWSSTTLWDSARVMRAGGVEVLVPSAEAGLVYLAVHLMKHGYDLRHAAVATCDAYHVLRAAGEALDRSWLGRQAAAPGHAVALHLLLARIRRPPSAAAADLKRLVSERVDAQGLRRQADALLRQAEALELSATDDFSLFELGDRLASGSAGRLLLDGVTRWRRRTGGHARQPGSPGLLTRLWRANWRYAYVTFLAGRLHARAGEAATPS
ncbi:MAG: nucleotidyltransferase family protein [Vicinamibacterales bacterium]